MFNFSPSFSIVPCTQWTFNEDFVVNKLTYENTISLSLVFSFQNSF